LDVGQVGVENAEGVEFSDVVATDLVSTDEELGLWGRSQRELSERTEWVP
jgi:hypothetical protein